MNTVDGAGSHLGMFVFILLKFKTWILNYFCRTQKSCNFSRQSQTVLLTSATYHHTPTKLQSPVVEAYMILSVVLNVRT